MEWSTLTFGKHKGKTLPQVLFADPDWFFWAYHEGALHNHMFGEEADLLNQRARNIKIPKPRKRWDHTLRHSVEEPPELPQLPFVGAMPTSRLDGEKVIDLGLPSEVQRYNKFGGHILIRTIKTLYFPKTWTGLTPQQCAQFFENLDNFALAEIRGDETEAKEESL